MAKFRVDLRATVSATLWVESGDEQEARTIAEKAWIPKIDSAGGYAGVDPTAEAVYDFIVDLHSSNTQSINAEKL